MNAAAQDERLRRFAAMTDAAAELIGRTIDEAEHDPKLLRYITGALKDLKELLDEPPGAAGAEEGGILIRIEGDVWEQESGRGEGAACTL